MGIRRQSFSPLQRGFLTMADAGLLPNQLSETWGIPDHEADTRTIDEVVREAAAKFASEDVQQVLTWGEAACKRALVVGRPDVASRIEAVCEYLCGKHAGDISTPGGESSNRANRRE
jgi:hypothetical protein